MDNDKPAWKIMFDNGNLFREAESDKNERKRKNWDRLFENCPEIDEFMNGFKKKKTSELEDEVTL